MAQSQQPMLAQLFFGTLSSQVLGSDADDEMFLVNISEVDSAYGVHPTNPWVWDMAFLLQFCGLSDPLQIFYLEQRNATADGLGPVYAAFRPFQLDALLDWALESARCRRWDGELIRHTVVEVWMERAEVIRQWQLRLRDEPADRLLVAALGSQQDWMHRCEQSLHA